MFGVVVVGRCMGEWWLRSGTSCESKVLEAYEVLLAL